MGHWSVSCGISNIAITSGQPVALLPLKKYTGRADVQIVKRIATDLANPL